MLTAAVGHSEDVDAADAIAEALAQCAAGLKGRKPQAALLLAGSDMDHQLLLDAVQRAHPGVPLIGGTSLAELSSRFAHAEDSVALLMLGGDGVVFGAGMAEGGVESPQAAAASAVQMARAALGAPPRLCLCISDAFSVSASAVLEGLQAALGKEVPVVGGAASSYLARNIMPREFFGTRVLDNAVTVLLMGGPLRFGLGVGCGWSPVGGDHRLTRARKNVVIQIDDRPAAEAYEGYLGPGSSDDSLLFAHHPLAVYEGGGDAFYLRAGYARGPEPGSILVAGEVPEGARARITDFDRDPVIAAAGLSLTQAQKAYGAGEPDVALIFSCMLRQTVLGTMTGDEVALVQRRLPPGLPMLGFYSLGEMAPLDGGQDCRVFNGGIITVLLGEA